MSTPSNDVQQLLKDKKYDEARGVISAAVTQKMTPKEKGAALTGTAVAFAKATNNVRAEYLDALKQAIESVKELNKTETKVKEKINLAEVREKLQNS